MFLYSFLTSTMVIVSVMIRIFTFVTGVYFLYYGVDLLVSGDPKPIPFISISTAGIEGRELPVGAFISVLGVLLIAIAAFMRGKAKTENGRAVFAGEFVASHRPWKIF